MQLSFDQGVKIVKASKYTIELYLTIENFNRDKVLNFILNNRDNLIGFQSLDNENSHLANLVMGLCILFKGIK